LLEIISSRSEEDDEELRCNEVNILEYGEVSFCIIELLNWVTFLSKKDVASLLLSPISTKFLFESLFDCLFGIIEE
jgi:uncharacterized membrane protein